jgi:PhoPQ-activated pathogenicity-related protein
MPTKRNIAVLCLLSLLGAGSTQAASTALKDYVSKPDASYTWRIQTRFEQGGSEVLIMRLDSQTWQDTVWKHQMYLIKPKHIDAASHQGIVIVGGGRWRDRYDTDVPSKLPRDAKLFLRMAQRLGAVVAVLGQVPFQPLFERTEDQIIAYTFDEFLKTGDPEWPLLLPMTKSVVRAMDAVQAASREQWNVELDDFTVLGGSKRGWTSWLTGVVDPRATALVPVVIDVLNFAEHFPHQVAMFGAPSANIQPYTERDLPNVLSSDAGSALRDIVDPYSYRAALTQPKLIVVATNDSYFPLDSLNLYWDGLVGEKHVLYLPNNDHNIKDYGRLIPSVAAFNRHVALGTPLPQLDWEFAPGESTIRLCVRSDVKPSRVLAWVAHSEDLDFRDEKWSSSRLSRSGSIVASIDTPRTGYTALYVEARYGRFRSAYSFTTNVRIFGAPGVKIPGDVPKPTAEVCAEAL